MEEMAFHRSKKDSSLTGEEGKDSIWGQMQTVGEMWWWEFVGVIFFFSVT